MNERIQVCVIFYTVHTRMRTIVCLHEADANIYILMQQGKFEKLGKSRLIATNIRKFRGEVP